MVELVTHPENENAIRLYKGTRQIRVILYAKGRTFLRATAGGRASGRGYTGRRARRYPAR